MSRSRGQLRKRGPNKWLVRVYIGRVGGKRKYKSKTVRGSKKEAEKKLTEMLRKKDRGVMAAPSSEKLEDFISDWLQMKKGKVAAATYRNYEKATRLYITPGLGHLKLDRVNTRLVQTFVDSLDQEQGLSLSYIRQIHTTLRQVLQQAVKWEMIAVNPADGGRIEFPDGEKREYRILSKEEIRHFLNVTRESRLYALWALLIATGMRPQEAFGLKWEDLNEDGWITIRRVVRVSSDADQKYALVNKTKTKQSKRRLKLPPIALNALDKHRTKQVKEMLAAGDRYERKGFVFTRNPRSGSFLYHEPVRRAFNDALQAADLPSEIRVYDLRHTHISQLIMDGVGLKFASERAGHSSITLTSDTYGHLEQRAEEEMAEVTEKIMGGTHG